MITDAKELNFNEKNYVCLSNDFAFSQQNLSKLAAVILRILVSNITPYDKEFFTYFFSVVELSAFVGKNKSNLYHDASEICRELENFTINNQDETLHVFSLAQYKNSLFYLRLDDRMKPYFLNLEKYYLQYPLGAVIMLKKSYSLRMLEIIWAKDGLYRHEKSTLGFTVSELREALGCNNKYSNFDLLNRKVLAPSLKEISLFTNLNCYISDCQLDKNHRKINIIEIEVHKKPALPGQILL